MARLWGAHCLLLYVKSMGGQPGGRQLGERTVGRVARQAGTSRPFLAWTPGHSCQRHLGFFFGVKAKVVRALKYGEDQARLEGPCAVSV